MMKDDSVIPKRKWSVIRIVGVTVLIVLVAAGVYLYNNFNRLLSEALMKTFDYSVISEVYELKFENLRVNLWNRNIRVLNVTLLPREKPAHDYPYINSSFRLSTDEIVLDSVHLRTLLQENRLNAKSITITNPTIEFMLAGKRHIMLPFKDSTASVTDSTQVNKKKILKSFSLKEFRLVDASFHIINTTKQREFKINNFSISFLDLLLDQQLGEYAASFDRVILTLGQLTGEMKKDKIQQIGFKGFNIAIDSLAMQLTLDTLIYRFRDFNVGMRDLDVQTADSLFHLTMQSFKISYHDQSIKLNEISFKPNVSHAVLQADYKFQHTEFSGTVKTLELKKVNFDSLIYSKKIFIDEIVLDSAMVSIFKDKTKPLNKNRFPSYLGQTVRTISLPLRINHVHGTHINLENTDKKPDSTLAKVKITRATMDVKNITNLSSNSVLTMHADAYLNDKAHFKAGLDFHYSKPQFDFEGSLEKFDLSGLSPLIKAYTPAKINKGVSDEISFSGVATEKGATGTMKFLYHDLEVDLELKDKAKWTSSVIAFAANTILDSSNPSDSDSPPKVVKFKIERDMNKGFVNVVIKSLLNGLKETMIMSKENRKAHKETKKKLKQANKK